MGNYLTVVPQIHLCCATIFSGKFSNLNYDTFTLINIKVNVFYIGHIPMLAKWAPDEYFFCSR